jgi:hypothetical protein
MRQRSALTQGAMLSRPSQASLVVPDMPAAKACFASIEPRSLSKHAFAARPVQDDKQRRGWPRKHGAPRLTNAKTPRRENRAAGPRGRHNRVDQGNSAGTLVPWFVPLRSPGRKAPRKIELLGRRTSPWTVAPSFARQPSLRRSPWRRPPPRRDPGAVTPTGSQTTRWLVLFDLPPPWEGD